jgi:hypothetical protein
MNPALVISARGENRRTESKLGTCGAEQVLEQMATSGDVDLVHLGLELDELELRADSPWVNRAIGEIEVRGAHS